MAAIRPASRSIIGSSLLPQLTNATQHRLHHITQRSSMTTAATRIQRARPATSSSNPYSAQSLLQQHNLNSHHQSRPFHASTRLHQPSMSHLYTDETPSDVKNAKGLHLITQSTPNGQAVQILLEELKDVYGLEFTTTVIDISTNVQKSDWFLRLNPNGRIPVLIDNTQKPAFPVHETSAELFYLLKFADKKDEFGFTDDLERNQALQWTFFWHGSGAPYFGQVNHFKRAAPEKIPYAIERFTKETLRVINVLEIHLSGKYTGEPREYLAGNGKGKYSIADIKTWPWVQIWEKAGFTKEEFDFPHVLQWIERISKRPAVQRGIGEAYAKK